MMMADENRWHRFLRAYSENAETTKASPAYILMLSEQYGFLLMVSLVTTAMRGPSRDVRMQAAIVLQDLTETDLLKNAYLDLPIQTLASLRSCALHLMVANEVASDVQEAGLLLTVDLLRQSLHHDDVDGWPELLQLMERAFTENLDILDLFIDVVCELPHRYVSRFVRFLAPCILRNHDPFINTLRYMLAQGFDQRVFVLLPYLYTELTETSWKRLLGAAITTPFFHNESRPFKRVIAAQNLLKSVKMTEYSFCRDWFLPLYGIITVLLNTDRPNDLLETILGIRLRSAMSTKRFD